MQPIRRFGVPERRDRAGLRERAGGRSKGRQELAETAIPLEARRPVLPCRRGEVFLRRLFEPLGYEVESRRLPRDETFPEWGESPNLDVMLRRTATLREFLTHLCGLVPVLDDEKHYYVGADEVERLLRFGEGWLASHPERDAITRRYLKDSFRLTREALARLEWTRGDLTEWCGVKADRFGYAVRFAPIGMDDPEVGPPTQMAVFTRAGA